MRKNRPELAVLVIIGFVLRIIGTSPGYFAHGDELMYGEAVYMILNKTLGMEPQILGYYPPLVAWIMLIFFVLIFIPLNFITHIPELLASVSLIDYFKSDILGKNWINAMYWGRYTTVIFGTGVIVLTYYLSQKICKQRLAAFLAALFVTVNYRLILNSKIGFLDIYSVFFLLVALLAIINLYQKPTLKKYLTSWISIGSSFLVKYQIYAVPVFLFVHFLISLKSSGRNFKKFTKNFFSKGFLAGGTLILLFVAVSHYYHFQHWEKVRSLYEYQALKYGLGINNLNIFPISYIYHIMLGPLTTITALGGLILSVLQKKYRIGTVVLLLTLASICFIYFYYSTGGSYTRNFLVILPLTLIFSAAFFTLLWEKFVNRQDSKPIKILASIALSVIILFSIKDQLKNTIVATSVLTQPSSRILIEKWINENIPARSTIGVYQGGFSPDENKFNLKTFSGLNEAISFEELKEEGLEYAIVDFYIVNNNLVWWMGQPTDIGLKFWNKPNNLLSQSYSALVIRELLWSHTVQAYLPKWQMPGYNYIVAKTDKPIQREYNLYNKYNFDSGAEGWRKLYYFSETKNLLTQSNEEGSLVILNENISSTDKIRRIYARPGSIRWESPPLRSQGNYTYKVSGKIKNLDALKKDDRNGFLRLDFYPESPEGFESRAITSFVSERVFGKSEWHEVTVEGIAPENAKFFTISFQVDQGKIPFSLDEVEIFESKEKIGDVQKNERYKIFDDDFFNPNDGGFL